MYRVTRGSELNIPSNTPSKREKYNNYTPRKRYVKEREEYNQYHSLTFGSQKTSLQHTPEPEPRESFSNHYSESRRPEHKKLEEEEPNISKVTR